MTIVLALVIGGLYALSVYLMMRQSILKLIIGIGLLSHAANLLVFTAGGLQRKGLPLVLRGESAPRLPQPDPLPQALVLTAIVIGFGIQAFALVLLRRAHQTVGTDDLDDMRSTESRL